MRFIYGTRSKNMMPDGSHSQIERKSEQRDLKKCINFEFSLLLFNDTFLFQ